jgi:acyl-CoA synthetase (AMP-forming)/AMP-acid ligase II
MSLFIASTMARRGLLRPGPPVRVLRQFAALRRWGFGLAGELRQAAARDPGRVAIVDDSRSVTYRELLDRAVRVARVLPVGPGDRVGILRRNSAAMVETVIGVTQAGADPVLINTGLSMEQIALISADQRLSMIICDDEFPGDFPASRLDALVSSGGDGDLPPPGRPGRTIVLTSGTTGLPKGARRPTPTGFGPLCSIIDRIPLHAGVRMMIAAPLFHTWGFAGLQIALALRATVVLRRKFDPAECVAAMAASECTALIAVPVMLQQIMELDPPDRALSSAPPRSAAPPRSPASPRSPAPIPSPTPLPSPSPPLSSAPPRSSAALPSPAPPASPGQPLSLAPLPSPAPPPSSAPPLSAVPSLSVVAVSGSALPGGLATRFMDRFGDVLYNLYGSTEASWVSIATPAELRLAPQTAGRPPHGTAVTVLDSAGQPVPPGTTGRLFVGNEMLFEGYTNGSSGDLAGGLLATGDVGHIDDDGLVFVSGRSDDMIVSGGENVFPSEVEDLLAALPAIREVAVVGVPDPSYGQRLAAYIALNPGFTLNKDDVREYVRRHRARFCVPRDIIFVPSLPRNATGKIVKRELPR